MMTLTKTGILRQKPVQTLNLLSTLPMGKGSSSSFAAEADAGPFVEKRRENRYETCEAVDICILETDGQRLPGILRDVSRSGLRVELSLAIKSGTRLEVVLRNKAIIFGEARYCRHSANTYQVGVVIEDIYYPKNDPAATTHDERRRRNLIPPSDTANEEKPGPERPDWAQTIVSQRQFLRCPAAHEVIGSHVSPDDVASFLHYDLSETKTALVERHLAACEECSYLMRLILEDYTSFVMRFGSDTKHIEPSFGRVTLKDPEALV